MQPLRKKNVLWTIALIAAPLVCAVLSLGMGRYSIRIPDILEALFGGLFHEPHAGDTVRTVLINVRLPRVLLALLAGAGLSVAGASFQSLFANPLATPDTLGVAAGASFGAALGILLGLPLIAVQCMALGWGVLAVVLAYLIIGRSKGAKSVIMIILAGMVAGALFSALVSIIKYVADPQDVLPAITFWLMGSLSGASLETLTIGAPLILAGMLVIFLMRWRLNAMSLHEDEARSLGVPVNLIRGIVVVASTMITASVISMCGLIGWVGLLIPHISRMIFGNNNQSIIPSSIGLGALFLLVMDTLARTVTAAEIPVSILTSIIGAPFFIVLLRKTGGVKI
jgi:iron complex transport system permease protein